MLPTSAGVTLDMLIRFLNN